LGLIFRKLDPEKIDPDPEKIDPSTNTNTQVLMLIPSIGRPKFEILDPSKELLDPSNEILDPAEQIIDLGDRSKIWNGR
jgi:tRNA A37 threonylcarbamoyladenosine dehydratase